jgi:hypothetical protein
MVARRAGAGVVGTHDGPVRSEALNEVGPVGIRAAGGPVDQHEAGAGAVDGVGDGRSAHHDGATGGGLERCHVRTGPTTPTRSHRCLGVGPVRLVRPERCSG